MRPASEPATPGGLSRALPDVPRWVETRSMLLLGDCELFGPEESEELSFVVRGTGYPLISVVGRPSEEAIREAVAGAAGYEVLVPPENETHVAAALPGWEAVSATLHLLGAGPRLPRVPAGTVRLLEPSELDSIEGLPSRLRSEFAVAARRSPIAASLAGGRPVAFCYSVQTESLWDISINTLEGHRGRGYASLCIAYMIEHLRPLRPVWGAEETNPPSLRLAARLRSGGRSARVPSAGCSRGRGCAKIV